MPGHLYLRSRVESLPRTNKFKRRVEGERYWWLTPIPQPQALPEMNNTFVSLKEPEYKRHHKQAYGDTTY